METGVTARRGSWLLHAMVGLYLVALGVMALILVYPDMNAVTLGVLALAYSLAYIGAALCERRMKQERTS
jgi:hypothetical protein